MEQNRNKDRGRDIIRLREKKDERDRVKGRCWEKEVTKKV